MSKHLQQIINAILNPDQPRAQVPSFSYRGPGQVKPVTPGLEQPKDNMFARPMYADGGKVGEVIPGTSDVILRDKPKEVAQRGIAVPFAEMSDGTTEWALPLILGGGVIDLIQNFGKYGDDDQYNTEQVMNALPVSGFGVARAAMRPAKDGMELGIFGGRNSKTADLAKLRLAEEFEAKGFAPELIRKGTGWFRGADKQWRYEIDDSQMKYLGPEADTLSGAVKHDKLFEAYPDLKDIPLEWINDKRFYGMYYPPFASHTEKISVRPSLDEKTIGQTLIHELQHAIQNREGFSSGAHPDFFQRTPEQMDILADGAKDYMSAYVLRRLLDKGMSESDAILKITQDYGAIAPGAHSIELANKKTAHELDEMTNYIYRVIRNASQPLKAYKSVTGEAEAMAAMKRKDLNELQRLQRSPLIDEGIPRNEQILIDMRTGMQKPAAMTHLDDDDYEFVSNILGPDPHNVHSYDINTQLRFDDVQPDVKKAIDRLDRIFSMDDNLDPANSQVYKIFVPDGTPHLDARKKPIPGVEDEQEIVFPRGGRLVPFRDGYTLTYDTKKASGGSVTDKMLEARARAIEPAAPAPGTALAPREPELRQFDQTWQDQIGQLLLGDDPSDQWRGVVDTLIGSSGLGRTGIGGSGIGVADLTPAGLAFAGQEGQRAAEEGDYLTAGLNAAAFLPMGKVPQALNKAKMFSMGAELARDLQPKGTVGQYIGQLTNAGVKPVELRNAGLIDDAGNAIDPNRKITRDELASMLQTKLPEVDEFVLGGQKYTPEDLPQGYTIKKDDWGQYVVTEEATGLNVVGRSEEDAVRNAFSYSYFRGIDPEGKKRPNLEPRFNRDDLVLPGGENYREVLLKLPIKTGDGKKLPDGYSISRNSYGQYIVDGPNGMVALSDTEEAAINWAREAIGAPKYNPSAYQSSHWLGQPNVVAHLRMSDRTGPNGEKILHLEELQSDWAQQGRKKGFVGTIDERKLSQYKAEADPQGRGFQIYDNANNKIGVVPADEASTPEEAIIAFAKADDFGKLPAAPYVTDTAQWTDLGLKRALREAAEGGYDRLIITPGTEQAKRYKLSTVVEEIEVEPSFTSVNNDTKRIGVHTRDGRGIDLYVNDEGKVVYTNYHQYKDKSLDEIVGKDVAKKLMTMEKPAPLKPEDFSIEPFVDGNKYYAVKNKNGKVINTLISESSAKAYIDDVVRASSEQPARLEGLDLDIGGKGMKDYYDKIVPNQLNDLVKKLDKGVKVEPYNISDDINTWSIPITPKMREEIMKGLPGFKKGGRVIRRAPGGRAGEEVFLPEIVVGEEPELPKEDSVLPLAPWAVSGPSPEVGTPLPDAPWTKPSRASAFGTAALQGLTANFYDELAGIYGAGVYEYLSGDPEAQKRYDSIVKEERGKQKAAAEEYPWTSFAGEVIGSIPAMAAIPFSPAARGLSYAQQVLRSALAGGTYGTAAGAGAGTDAESRQEGALWGAGTGTLGGFAAPLVNKSLAWVYDRTLRPVGSVVQGWMRPENVTAARLAGAIGQDQQDIIAGKVKGLTLADWQAAKARGEPVTLADLGAGRTQALLRSAANSSPEGRAVIEEIIDTRFKNQAERIATDIRHMTTGRKADALRTADQLRADYDAKRTPMYRKAFAQPNAQAMWDSELEQLSQAPVVQEAIRAALVSGKDAAAKAGFTPLKNPFKTNPATNRFELLPGQYPNLQFWDAVKKNLDGINSAEARFWARNLRNHLDSIVPEYGDARGMAHKFFGEEDALEAGRKLAGKKQIVNEQLARDLRKLSPEELELFREGYAYDLAERIVRNLSETRNLTKAIYNSPGERERILTVFGPQGAAKLEARMALETILDGARQALGNSTTARQLIEAGLAGGAAGAYFSGMDPQTTAFAAAVLAGGRGAAARSAMANEAMSGVRTVAGYVDRGVAKRVAEALVSDDPTILAEGIEMVIKNQKLRAGLTDLANATLNAGFARIGEQ